MSNKMINMALLTASGIPILELLERSNLVKPETLLLLRYSYRATIIFGIYLCFVGIKNSKEQTKIELEEIDRKFRENKERAVLKEIAFKKYMNRNKNKSARQQEEEIINHYNSMNADFGKEGRYDEHIEILKEVYRREREKDKVYDNYKDAQDVYYKEV